MIVYDSKRPNYSESDTCHPGILGEIEISKMAAKVSILYIFAAILKMCACYVKIKYSIVFLVYKNIYLDERIVFLC